VVFDFNIFSISIGICFFVIVSPLSTTTKIPFFFCSTIFSQSSGEIMYSIPVLRFFTIIFYPLFFLLRAAFGFGAGNGAFSSGVGAGAGSGAFSNKVGSGAGSGAVDGSTFLFCSMIAIISAGISRRCAVSHSIHPFCLARSTLPAGISVSSLSSPTILYILIFMMLVFILFGFQKFANLVVI